MRDAMESFRVYLPAQLADGPYRPELPPLEDPGSPQRKARIEELAALYAREVVELRLANPSGRRPGNGRCPRCRRRPKAPGHSYCRPCANAYNAERKRKAVGHAA